MISKTGRPTNEEREKKLNEKYEKYKESKGESDDKVSIALGEHSRAAEAVMQKFSEGWDDKEAMLICRLRDSASTSAKTHSGVFDPRLSTIVFERAARVMSQNPVGKAFAVSRNDMGKNQFMNLLLKYYQNNANQWHSMILKSRMLDLYSLVYGTMFALVPWVVDTKRNYIGPEMIPLPIRTCFPQPGATSIEDCDWFQVSSMKNFDWLERQSKLSPKWKNIDKLKISLLGDKGYGTGDSKPDDQSSYIEKTWYDGNVNNKDSAFPEVQLKTEYRRDRWITFAPKYENLILRDIPNPYNNGELPIVAKYAFPLMDSIIGLGEFERGKTLQYAINSLINLYLDGVKYSIFPPIQIDPNSVIASTIKWGPGEKWLTKKPGIDIKQLRLSPGGLQTFNSTYGFLVSSLMNQAGTSEVNSSANVESSLGKTPQALRLMSSRETARDEWDRTMMEDTLKSVYKKWIDMIVAKQEKSVTVRIFGDEAKQIARDYPDVAQFFKKDNYGVAKIGKEQINSSFDYEIEAGSTMKPNLEGDNTNVSNILALVLKNPQIISAMHLKGQEVDLGELFKRWISTGGIKDWDKIITQYDPEGQQEMTERLAIAQLKTQMKVQQITDEFKKAEQAKMEEQKAAESGQPGGQPQQGQEAPPEAPQGQQQSGGQQITPEMVQQLIQSQNPVASQMKSNGPKQSISYKDLPPEGQVQMAAQAGIQLNPQSILASQQTQQAQKVQIAQQTPPDQTIQVQPDQSQMQPQMQPQEEVAEFDDPQINAAFNQMLQTLGGVSNIPPMGGQNGR